MAVNQPEMSDRVAFVAGASRGIGPDISMALASSEAAVAVAARTEEPGNLAGTIHSVADAIAADGGTALPVACDVADQASVQSAITSPARSSSRALCCPRS
jgi:citronellol/citronellal dehydrogenase